MNPKISALAVRLALVGLVIQLLGIFVTIHYFNQFNDVVYSPLNHFVSELTAPTLSPKAWVMSLTMMIGSILSLPSLFALAARIQGWLAYSAFAAGLISSLSVILLGFAPMENLGLHLFAAMTFFWAWLLTVFLFGVAFWRRFGFRASPFLVLTSGFSLLTSGAFLIIVFASGILRGISSYQIDPAEVLQLLRTFKRPAIWEIAILEWSVVLFVFVWVIANVMYLSRRTTAEK